MTRIKMNSLERKWSRYDAGNSAFSLLTTSLCPVYFNGLAKQANVSSANYLAMWGYAASIVTIAVVFLGPIAGAIADGKDMKKKVFFITVLVGVIATLSFAIPMYYLAFLIMYMIAKTAFQTSLVVYDSMLPDITTHERMDTVSSVGFAVGYIYSCIPFAASIALIYFADKIGLSKGLAVGIGFTINAVWWLVWSIPLFKSYKQIHYTKEQDSFSKTFKNLKNSLVEIKNNKKILFFLIGFFFYIDGVYTIISMSVAYGSSLGLDGTGLLLALLVTQIVAFPSVLIFGKLAQKVDTSLLIKICIVAYFGITIFAVWLDSLTKFWILAICVGMFQGAIQALSRSYFAKIIPHEESGKYFSIYDICGKGAALLGTLLVGVVVQISGNQSLGILMLSSMFIFGIVFFIIADKKALSPNNNTVSQ